MNRRSHVRVLIAISFIITIGFLVAGFNAYHTYSEIIEEDTLNITQLTSTNIYSEINVDLVKPIFVSLTMASDSFLKSWMAGIRDEADIRHFLNEIRTKYGYSSAFLIAADTLHYYHTDGVLKTIQKEDAHDVWYYDFVASEQDMALDIDLDEANDQMPSIFINCRVEDKDGKLLGVTGVALKLDQVRKKLQHFEDLYGVEAYLTNTSGLVQVHSNPVYIETLNVFEDVSLKNDRTFILSNRTSPVVTKLSQDGTKKYLISRYIPELNWILFVQNDTDKLQAAFYKQLTEETLVLLIVLLSVLGFSIAIIRTYQRKLHALAISDDLTGIGNRRVLRERLATLFEENKRAPVAFSLLIFDVDGFKRLNDTKGHSHGDAVLCRMVAVAKQALGAENPIYRWGGDEFTGILMEDSLAATVILKKLCAAVENDEQLAADELTISVGIAVSDGTLTPEHLLYQADIALYQAKNAGKNQVVCFS